MKYNYIVVALLAQMTAVQVAADTGYDYLGYGRLVTNDLLGDGKDRWRTGSVSAFRMYVQEDVDLKHLKLGQAVELRTHFEVVAPSDLQDDSGGDRPWGGAISLGLHSPFHYGSLQMSLGADVHVIGQNSGLTGFQQDLHKGLGIKHAGDAVSNNKIKDETVMGVRLRPLIQSVYRIECKHVLTVRCVPVWRMWPALGWMSILALWMQLLQCRAIR